MKKTLLKLFNASMPGKLLLASALALGVGSVQGENVFITSYYGNTATTTATPPPHSVSTNFTLFGASSFSMSTASPSPGVSPRRIIYGRAPEAAWSVTPADGSYGAMTFTALQNIGVYKIYVTKGQSGNASTNIIVNMTATGGDLSDSNGVGSVSVPLDVYQRSKPNHVWVHVGYITNNTTSPTITFTHASGAIDDNADANLNTGQRWYVDAVWFEFVDSCVGVAPQLGVAGPLAQGQAFVNVVNVAAGATNVVVYANGSEVGQTNFAGGFAAGSLTVPTSVLNKGDIITAKQIKNGCESLLATSGPEVGGGPNPQIRAFLGMWKDSSLAGPIGANVITNNLTVNYFLKANGLTGGFGTAFTGGETLAPSQCWQTVTFSHADENYTSSGSTIPIEDAYAALSGLAFSIDDTDSGPYEIYVDQIMNGDVVIEDFESYAIGTTNTFNAANKAALPSPSSFLSEPNSSTISANNAFDGTKSCRIQWQWTDSTTIRWAHVLANASTNSGKHYPQIDTSKPITIRYLVLPVGESTNKLHFTSVPQTQSKAVGESVTFSVQAVGEGNLTYQWRYEGGDITDATGTSYSKSGLQTTDSGLYSVLVSSDTGCSAPLEARLTVTETVTPPTLNYSVVGNQITLTWTGSFTLQSKTSLDAAWENVTAVSGYSENLTSGTKFFRLRN